MVRYRRGSPVHSSTKGPLCILLRYEEIVILLDILKSFFHKKINKDLSKSIINPLVIIEGILWVL